MRYLPIDSIRISPDRQRRSFDEESLGDLANSIRSNGLLHPIVVRQGVDSGYTLVAGERRLRAVEMLELQGEHYGYGEVEVPAGQIPANFLGELSPQEAEEAELTENIHRIDLTWQERVEAINKIGRLKELQSGSSIPSTTLGPEIFPEMDKTAAGQAVRTAQILARHMNDPDVAKAKTTNDAIKVVRRKEEARVNSILAAEVGTQTASELHAVYHADCRQWLADCASGRFDCILIDPPYGMGADSFGDGAGKRVGIEHDYADDAEHASGLIRDVAGELFRVGKPQTHLYVWCDIDLFLVWREIFEAAGWWTFRTPLINIKREGGRVPWPEHGPRRCYEIILYAVKGKRPVTHIYRDVFESTLERDTGGHGASKPIEAYVDLLRRSCRPGDTVLDCFAGSGTILPAAHQLKLRATAVECDQAYYGQCVKRLQGLDEEDDGLKELGL